MKQTDKYFNHMVEGLEKKNLWITFTRNCIQGVQYLEWCFFLKCSMGQIT